MRKRTIRCGMRLVLTALLLIIVVSFYHESVSGFFSISYEAEMRLYQYGIFMAAALGGYGVVSSAFGLVLPARHQDAHVRILPSFFLIICVVSFFFYLLTESFNSATEPPRDRLLPGETITI